MIDVRVYDKPIVIKKMSDTGEWETWKHLLAFVNKTKDSTSSLTFEVRYTRNLKAIFSYMEEFIIVYRGDVYLIEDYDDYMESHLTVKFKASILRLGKFTGSVTILKKTLDKDEDGFATQSETSVATVRCYHEGRDASTRWANLAAFTEVTDLFQIQVIPDVELSRAYVLPGRRSRPTKNRGSSSNCRRNIR